MDQFKYDLLFDNNTLHESHLGLLRLALDKINANRHHEAAELLRAFIRDEQTRLIERRRMWHGTLPRSPYQDIENRLRLQLSQAIKPLRERIPAGVR
jgi:hypothetical protein